MKLRPTILILIALFSGTLSAQQPLEIGSPLKFMFRAPVTPDGVQKRMLEVETVEVYADGNYQLVFETYEWKGFYTMKFTGVEVKGPSTGHPGPARAMIDLTDLGHGDFPVKWIIMREIYKGSMHLGEDYCSIQTKEKYDPVRIPNGWINMLPKPSIWGDIWFEKDEDTKVAQAMQAELAALDEVNEIPLPSGNYGYFYVFTPNKTDVMPDGTSGFRLPFAYGYIGETEKISDLIARWKEKYGDRMKVTLMHSNGKVWKTSP